MKNLKNAFLLKQLYQLKNLGYRYTDENIYQEDLTDLQLPDTLEALYKQAMRCHLCALSKNRTKTVFGEGKSDADILFIGEAPGAGEDLQGRPFVGKSGEMLTKMIENVLDISRSEVYIANIVKCRPPENREPTPAEAHTCLPYLQKQIALIKPKLIVTLGTTAYRYLTEDATPISQVRGIVKQYPDYIVIPTYHPSYLLRNPSAKREVFEDLKKVKNLM